MICDAGFTHETMVRAPSSDVCLGLYDAANHMKLPKTGSDPPPLLVRVMGQTSLFSC